MEGPATQSFLVLIVHVEGTRRHQILYSLLGVHLTSTVPGTLLDYLEYALSA